MRRFAAAVCLMLLLVGLTLHPVYAQDAAAGLKEALTTGTSDAVAMLGKPGGYLDNPAVKIQFPEKLQMVEKGLRAMGMNKQIDDLVVSMNKAAEAAAPKAQPIFVNAIQTMSFTDAQKILTKGGHSATDYFQRKTTPELTTAFTPVVKDTMAQNSVTKQYNDLIGKYSSGAMGNLGSMLGGHGATPDLDINSYVVKKSLDGLFYEVGQEEVKIRTNPAAQVTPLLKQVFGGGH